MRVTKYITFIFLLWFAEYLKGQNVMTSSPYSMFGIGELVTGSNGANAGMGNVAIGMRGTKLINMDNPAGLSGVDSCRLLADVYVFAKWENYYSGGDKNDAFTGNFSGMSLAGRMLPRWYERVNRRGISIQNNIIQHNHHYFLVFNIILINFIDNNANKMECQRNFLAEQGAN